ncbi:MAG: hypothetical protein R2771_13435 [Saprospiraceae bacterium]
MVNIDWSTQNIYEWPTLNESRPLYQRIMSIPKYKSTFYNIFSEALENVYVPEK